MATGGEAAWGDESLDLVEFVPGLRLSSGGVVQASLIKDGDHHSVFRSSSESMECVGPQVAVAALGLVVGWSGALRARCFKCSTD